VADIIQIRRDTASNWTTANPTLAQGELGIETDTLKVKAGTGSANWSSLGYLINTNSYAEYSDSTANFTGTLQNGGSNVVVDTDIGSTVQAFDSNTALYDAVTSNFTGALQKSGSPVVTQAFTGDVAITGGLSVTATTSIAPVIEKVTVQTSTTGTINFDFLTQAVQLYTANQTANRTINFRGNGSTTLNNSMAIGQSMTAAVLMTQGSSAYYLNTYQVDGSAATIIKWSGGAPTGGNASAIDVYSFTVIKTANAAFTVLASLTGYE
jgi:hypothetical protein